jgi:hypothetical protein
MNISLWRGSPQVNFGTSAHKNSSVTDRLLFGEGRLQAFLYREAGNRIEGTARNILTEVTRLPALLVSPIHVLNAPARRHFKCVTQAPFTQLIANESNNSGGRKSSRATSIRKNRLGRSAPHGKTAMLNS